MPGPLGALAAILRQAPLIVTTANTLLARSRGPAQGAADLDTLRQRLADLEEHQKATAALSKELADHASAVAAAVQANAAAARRAILLAVVAAGLSAGTLVLTLILWLTSLP